MERGAKVKKRQVLCSLRILSELCPVGSREGLNLVYCCTCGSLTMTYGGNEGKGVD